MKILNFVFAVLVSMLLILGFFLLGPEIETRFFPVYSKFRLISAEALPDGKTFARFEFTKFRNCDPQGFAFFNGELGTAFTQVTTRVRGSAIRARPLGTQQSYPYEFTDITPEELATTVFAEIYSHCHPLWTTRTKVYP